MGAAEPAGRREAGARARIAEVLPDVRAIDRTFDYLIPEELAARVRVGTLVRVPLHGRRVAAWVVAVKDSPDTDRPLQPLARVTGWGPSSDVVELARWAAWRWAGPRTSFLRTASPPVAVHGLPVPPPRLAAVPAPPVASESLVGEAFALPGAVVRVPPAGDPFNLVLEAAARPDPLVLTPSLAGASRLVSRLRQSGHVVALLPRDWARAAAGGCVAVGARAAAWAPRPRLGAVVVLDEHDEAFKEERTPAWHARDVARERAGRAGVPCLLTSPCPSLEALSAFPLLVAARGDERAGWPVIDVVDRRADPPGSGLYSDRLVDAVRYAGRVVCVLNRKGRASLLACAACGELARCERCEAVVEETEGGLRCRRCGSERPSVCLECGATRLRRLRVGVSRAREELERLARRPVAEVSAGTDAGPVDAPVVVGTEAVLHRVEQADVVAFLELDQELLAPRYRAGEEAMALLARAARLVGGRTDGGRVVVQTRLPDHEVIDAAVHADPSRLAVVEAARRAALRFPPERALAMVSGEAAEAYAAGVRQQPGVDVQGPVGDRWLIWAPDHGMLCDVLAAVPRPPGRLRVEVDPLRV